MVLLRNTVTQMVYKHAISTVVPGPGSELPPESRLSRLEFFHRHRRHGRPPPARAVLVGVDLGGRARSTSRSTNWRCWPNPPATRRWRVSCTRRKAPDPALFVGSRQGDEIKALVGRHRAEAVLFDQALSPAQQRNLERHLGVPVADRTMLILEIFAARRATRASCRSSWRGCNTSPPAWCGAGATWSASRAASARAAARAKRRSNWTGA